MKKYPSITRIPILKFRVTNNNNIMIVWYQKLTTIIYCNVNIPLDLLKSPDTLFVNYFSKTWVKRFPPSLWAGFFIDDRISKYRTNNYIESQFKELKSHLKKPNMKIDQLIDEIYDYQSYREKREISSQTQRSIHPHPLDDVLLRSKKKSLFLYFIEYC